MKYFKVKISFICIILLGLNLYENRVASATSIHTTNSLQMNGLSRHSGLSGEMNKTNILDQNRFGNSYNIDLKRGDCLFHCQNSLMIGNDYLSDVHYDYVEAKEIVPIYVFQSNLKSMVIGHLLMGQQLEITMYRDPNFYQIRWGKKFAFIERDKVKPVEKPSYKNKEHHINMNALTQYFIPNTDGSEIFDNSSEQLVPFAKLDLNHRYPLIGQYEDSYITTIGGRIGYINKDKVSLDRGVPVLMYHHILKEEDLGVYKNQGTTITDVQFSEEMQYLANQNFETVSIYELEKYMRNEIPLSVHSIVITFDDGLLSTREYAYPILKEYGFQATQFLITNRNNLSPANQVFNPKVLQFFSHQDMNRMQDVFAYESHTYNLHNIENKKSKVLTVSYDELLQDLQSNRSDLPHSKGFAYPFGQYDDNTIQALKSTGYTMAFTTKIGYNNPYDDLYQIKRISTDQSTDLTTFQQLVTPYIK